MASAAPLMSRTAAPNAVTTVDRIRVVYCVATMHVGGTEMNALRTAERVDSRRFEIVVASLAGDGPLMQRYRDAGIRVVPFPITSLYNRTALEHGVRMYRLLRRERIDVLHCHDMYSNVFAAPWGRLARVPIVIASRRWIHTVDDARLELANRMVYRIAHRVLGNSGAVVSLLKNGDGVPARRILELPNFVDDRAFQPPASGAARAFRARLHLPPEAVLIGCIARLVPVKDHATLIRAMTLLAKNWPAAHLVLVGDGSCRPELEHLATTLGVADRVHFPGYLPNDPNLNHLFDIVTLASLSEGFPNSLVEAMAAGRPVVATAAGGNVDAVRADTGLLVPIREPVAMAAAIERLLADEAMRERLGSAALRVARTEYHATTVVRRLEGMYHGLLDRPPARNEHRAR